MSVLQFPDRLYVRTIGTGETVLAARVNLAEHSELGHIRLMILKHGAHAGSEQLRLGVYADEAMTKLIYQSAWSALADVSGLTDHWIGWLRFDFAREHMNHTHDYYLGVETTGYTRDADTFYLGLVLDWPDPVYALTTGPTQCPAAIQIYDYRERA